MDLSSIVADAAAALPFPWSLVAGAVIVVAYQFLKVKFPNLLGGLPHLVPLPSPEPTPDSPLPAHPILDGLARMFGLESSGNTLAEELANIEKLKQVVAPVLSPLPAK